MRITKNILAKRKNKYNAVKTKVDGFTFDSKAEAKRYEELKLLQMDGQISYFLCQVPFRLPGGIIYRVDFQIFGYHIAMIDRCGLVRTTEMVTRYEDVKGVLTDVSKIKIKQVQEIYGIKINLITKQGVKNI